MGKDLSAIKLKQNSGINLYFEDVQENANVLIVGNTIGFFGYVDNGNLNTNSKGDLKRLGWLIKSIQKKINFTIIGEIEEKEYYLELFNTIYNKYNLKAKVKFMTTTNNEDYFEYFNKFNDMPKFDYCIMNPPYGTKEDGNYLDIKFINKCLEYSDKQISIAPAKLASNAGIYKNFFKKNIIKNIELIDPHEAFGINPFGAYKFLGIYEIDTALINNKLNISLNNNHYIIDNTHEARVKFIHEQTWESDIVYLINKFENLRKELFKKYNSMVNDGHGFIYEENRLQRGKIRYNVTKKDNHTLDRVKKYLNEGIYKYCIYKGSGNNSYDKPQEWLGQDVNKLFKGQICWLTNNETIKNNIIYWMESPLFDLWRIYYFNHSKYSVGCLYGHLPALDFELSENKFKNYVNSLNKFNFNDINILKKYNIHNFDKLNDN